jgi:hypothetical protein
VHAPQGALALAEGDTALRYLNLQAMPGKLSLAEGASEKTSIIFPFVKVDHECAFQECLDENQNSPYLLPKEILAGRRLHRTGSLPAQRSIQSRSA